MRGRCCRSVCRQHAHSWQILELMSSKLAPGTAHWFVSAWTPKRDDSWLRIVWRGSTDCSREHCQIGTSSRNSQKSEYSRSSSGSLMVRKSLSALITKLFRLFWGMVEMNLGLCRRNLHFYLGTLLPVIWVTKSVRFLKAYNSIRSMMSKLQRCNGGCGKLKLFSLFWIALCLLLNLKHRNWRASLQDLIDGGNRSSFSSEKFRTLHVSQPAFFFNPVQSDSFRDRAPFNLLSTFSTRKQRIEWVGGDWWRNDLIPFDSFESGSSSQN